MRGDPEMGEGRKNQSKIRISGHYYPYFRLLAYDNYSNGIINL